MKFLTSLGYVASLCLSMLLVIGVYKETHSFSLTFALALLFAIVRPWRLDNWLDVWIDAHRVMDQHKAPLRSNSAFKPYGVMQTGDFQPIRMRPVTTAELVRLKERAAALQLLPETRDELEAQLHRKLRDELEAQLHRKRTQEEPLANPKKKA